MEIQSLKLVITDADLNAILAKHLPADAPVEKLQIGIIAGSVQVSGKYPAGLLKVPFSTNWEPTIDRGRLRLKLGNISVVGLPAGMLRGLAANGLRHAAEKLPGASVEEDTLVLDVDGLLTDRGIPMTSNLKTIRCEPGRMTVEA